MFLSDMLIELVENTECDNEEEEIKLLLFIYQICIEEIINDVPIRKGIYNIEKLKIKLTQINNILNVVKDKTKTELYPKDPIYKHYEECMNLYRSQSKVK